MSLGMTGKLYVCTQHNVCAGPAFSPTSVPWYASGIKSSLTMAMAWRCGTHSGVTQLLRSKLPCAALMTTPGPLNPDATYPDPEPWSLMRCATATAVVAAEAAVNATVMAMGYDPAVATPEFVAFLHMGFSAPASAAAAGAASAAEAKGASTCARRHAPFMVPSSPHPAL